MNNRFESFSANNKFGMFIHWGLYAISGVHEQVIARDNIENGEYEKLINEFNPSNYNPEEWVLMAKRAGMDYICFTTKHHDGFCMWDTKYTDYNVMNTPYGKDVVRMLSDACQKHGMKLSFYYSNPDWHHEYGFNPKSTHQWKSVQRERINTEEYREYQRNQIRELLTNYGPIYTFFWDIPPCYEDRSMNEFIRSLQPDILINDRGYDRGDFSTPEREVPDGSRFKTMTEACQSVGVQAWGYRKNEDYYSSRFLMSSIDKIMAMGGSYLLNVGPKADGTVCDEAKRIIEKVGDWYTRMDGALEGTEQDKFEYILDSMAPDDPYIAVRKGKKSYLHFYNGISATCVTFEKCPGAIKSARCLNDKKVLEIRHTCLPAHFGEDGFAQGPFWQAAGIDADNLTGEPVVIEIEWEEEQ